MTAAEPPTFMAEQAAHDRAAPLIKEAKKSLGGCSKLLGVALLDGTPTELVVAALLVAVDRCDSMRRAAKAALRELKEQS